MFLWTGEKIYSILTPGGNPFLAILWWFAFMYYLAGAFRVEQLRRKLKTNK